MQPTSFRPTDADAKAIVEIGYYLKTSQPPGYPEPTVTDAIRYALAIAAAGIAQEHRKENN